MMKPIFLFAIFFGSCASALAQSQKDPKYYFEDKDRLQKLRSVIPVVEAVFKEQAQRSRYPGLVFGIVYGDSLIYVGETGMTNIENKTKVSAESVFRIASMSKSFTAMAIMKLRDAGRLQLDDPVYKYIPEMKAQKYPTSDASDITIRHLMIHAAGFPEDNPWGDRQLADTEEELLDLIKKGVSFSNDPGLVYEYSNLGFAMLGYIVHKVSGLPYHQYITENILQPLGMTHTEYEYSKVPERNLALGYRWEGNTWVRQPLLHDGIYGAMGGMLTSAKDFAKYMSFHLKAWPPSDQKETGPVKRSSVREMHYPWNYNGMNPNYRYNSKACPVASAYAYGLTWSKDCEGRVMIGHSGGLPGFGSNWRVLPDYGFGIFSFANLTYAGTGGVNTKVIDTIMVLTGMKPRRLLPSKILLERKEQLVKMLPSWDTTRTVHLFADNFFLDYSLASLQSEAKSIFMKAGKILKVGEIVPENLLRGTFIMEGEKANVQIRFTLTPEDVPKIQEYRISQQVKI